MKMAKTLDNHNYHGIDATVIADSKNEYGNRIISYVITFPRIVLAEFNTHRMLSRNSASSRAIPFEKMLKNVEEHPFIPIRWMKSHKGMQGNEYFDKADMKHLLRADWLHARDEAVNRARKLAENGLTKQIVNRLLEPWLWHTAIVTATEWENFFALRAHPAAEIHIADLAQKMLDAANESTPNKLKAGEWHIPFGDNINIHGIIPYGTEDDSMYVKDVEITKVKIATARGARVSYLNFEGKDDYEADIKLHDNLLEMLHMSPFEHCAKAQGNMPAPVWSGNFFGFTQYRKMIEGENQSDDRLLKK